MQVNLKSVNGLQTQTMVTNYHMRKPNPEEDKILERILQFRKLEVMERLEKQPTPMVDNLEVGRKLENYLVNAFSGKQVYVINDYEKKDEVQDKKTTEKKRGNLR